MPAKFIILHLVHPVKIFGSTITHGRDLKGTKAKNHFKKNLIFYKVFIYYTPGVPFFG